MSGRTAAPVDTEALVRAWYGAIGRGDIDAVLEGMAADIEFVLPDNEWNRIIDYVGTWRGRDAVADAFARRGARNEILAYEISDVVAAGPIAYVRCYTRARHVPTGRVYEVDDVHRVELDDRGEIAHWTAFFDPNTERAAYLEEAGALLVTAAQSGDADTVTRLTGLGADPDTVSGNRRPVLHIAAGRGHEAAVEALIHSGATIDARDSTGNTALHVACQGGHLGVVRRLLAAGADVEATTSGMGHTPLVEAVWYLWEDVVTELLEAGADLDVVTHYGATIADHLEAELAAGAARRELTERMRDLLADQRTRRTERAEADALMRAITAGDAAKALTLLAASDGSAVDRVDPSERATPLFAAASRGMTEVVVALLGRGADPNRLDPVFLASPMHLAAYNGHAETLRALVADDRADIDLQGPVNGYAPIHDAAFHGQRLCVEVLVCAGARLDLRGHDGRTAAELAAWSLGAEDPLVRRLVAPAS